MTTDISTNKQHWRYRGEEFTTRMGAVPMVQPDGYRYSVAKIDDVRKAAQA